MASGRYFDYIIRSRETGEVLFQGSMGKCCDYLGCGRGTIKTMVSKNKTTTQGFYNSRYEITRGPEKVRGRKHYKVYKDGQLVVEGSSWDCAKALGVEHKQWYMFVYNCSIDPDPKYIIKSDWK